MHRDVSLHINYLDIKEELEDIIDNKDHSLE